MLGGLCLGNTWLSAKTALHTSLFSIVYQSYDSRTRQIEYYLQPIPGKERINNSLNRLSMISENQQNYPQPESGCGPTAMLNILVWYQKFGLIQPFTRESNPTSYKQKLFREIDRRLTKEAGHPRTENIGSASGHIAIVMDEMVRDQSNGQLRIQTQHIDPPLQLKDLLDTMPNFRAGYLMVTPKNPKTGEIMQNHAVTLIRADRAGYITLGTWGQIYRGILRKRSDGQWFIPQDPNQYELKIIGMIRFTPFEPVVAASDS